VEEYVLANIRHFGQPCLIGHACFGRPDMRGVKTILDPSERFAPCARDATDQAPPITYLISASWLMRHSQERLFHALRRPAQSFASWSHFLSLFDGCDGCVCLDTEDLEWPLSQCVARLRQQTSRLPIILLSGGMPAKRRDELIQHYPPLCVLDKPVRVQHLLAAIDASFRLAMLTARGHK
jgi:FixJ family two-component response regulator